MKKRKVTYKYIYEKTPLRIVQIDGGNNYYCINKNYHYEAEMLGNEHVRLRLSKIDDTFGTLELLSERHSYCYDGASFHEKLFFEKTLFEEEK